MERMDRIEETLDLIRESIKNIDVSLASQRILLKEYSKRMALLEKRFTQVEHQAMLVEGVVKLLGFLAAIAALVEGGHYLTGLFK